MKHLTMKKFLALGLAASMSLSLLTSCGGQRAGQPSADPTAPGSAAPVQSAVAEADYGKMTIEELKPLVETVTPGKLTMVTSPDFAPSEFYVIGDDGTPTLAGQDIALAHYIADYIGLELEIVPIDFDGVLMEIQNKAADIALAGLASDPKREAIMDFSISYEPKEEGNQSFICLKENLDKFSDFDAANDPDYQLGAQIGSIQADFAAKYTPDAEIIQMAKVTDIISELIAGNLDGAYMANDTAEAYIANYPDLCIALDVPNDFEGTSAGLKKDSPALLAAVNLAIQAALDDGSIAKFKAEAKEQALGNIYEGLLDADGNIQG